MFFIVYSQFIVSEYFDSIWFTGRGLPNPGSLIWNQTSLQNDWRRIHIPLKFTPLIYKFLAFCQHLQPIVQPCTDDHQFLIAFFPQSNFSLFSLPVLQLYHLIDINVFLFICLHNITAGSTRSRAETTTLLWCGQKFSGLEPRNPQRSVSVALLLLHLQFSVKLISFCNA